MRVNKQSFHRLQTLAAFVWSVVILSISSSVFAHVRISVQRLEPCNLFQVDERAIIDSNTAMAPIKWGRDFINAGSMAGMNMVAVHPYSFTPLPGNRTGASIRNYRDFLRAHAGRDLDIYLTECRWSTAANDNRHRAVSEQEQA